MKLLCLQQCNSDTKRGQTPRTKASDLKVFVVCAFSR